MLTNIDQQFAQVRENLERLRYAISTPNEFRPKADDALAALSVIERHVQDMETALDVLRWFTGEDCWCGIKSVDDADWHTPKCEAVRAALPAREKGTE